MGKAKFVLDSTAVIDFAKGALGPASALSALLNGKLYISVITRIETLAFPGISPAEESRIRAMLTILKVIPPPPLRFLIGRDSGLAPQCPAGGPDPDPPQGIRSGQGRTCR